MSLVSFVEQMKKAQSGGYAIPCFDTFEMNGTQGLFDALQEQQAPAFIGLYTGMFMRPYAKALTDMVRAMAEEATVPVSIVLDHGASFEHCMKALKLGFTDVMFDGSQLPIEENIAETREVVRVAHAIGAGVEAELGHVGSGNTYSEFGALGKGYTDPDSVVRFVEETGVDMLAVAIGTAHGLYDGDPLLDLDLLAEIRRRTDIPLVLHGGSGLSDEQFRAAAEGGICKINIFTNLAVRATQQVVEAAKAEHPNLHGFTEGVRQGFREVATHLIQVFGADGKA